MALYMRRRGMTTTETASVIHENTITTTEIPSVVADGAGEAAPTALSTGLVIQLLIFAAILFGGTAFVLKRRRRRRDRELHRHKYQNAFEIRQISSPNGLGCGGGGGGGGGQVPPTYYEALKSPIFPGKSDVSAAAHHRPKSNSAVMDECMRAVYDAENDLGAGAGLGHHHSHHHHQIPSTPSATSHAGEEAAPPASPRDVARGDTQHSVSRWLRNQRWLPGAVSGPLTSNPHRPSSSSSSPPPSAGLPAPPTPSYRGIPAAGTPTPTPALTPASSAPPPLTPWSAARLAPPCPSPPYAEDPHPLPSARSNASWATTGGGGGGDDRLSIRASIPSSVLYPSPLQPAPPPRRRSGDGDGSVASPAGAGAGAGLRLSLYPRSETWRTMTPHEDPPEYEPRRGDPDKVSPI